MKRKIILLGVPFFLTICAISALAKNAPRSIIGQRLGVIFPTLVVVRVLGQTYSLLSFGLLVGNCE